MGSISNTSNQRKKRTYIDVDMSKYSTISEGGKRGHFRGETGADPFLMPRYDCTTPQPALRAGEFRKSGPDPETVNFHVYAKVFSG